MKFDPETLSWLVVLAIGMFGVALIWRLYRMATDPKTRLRDAEGRAIEPGELGDDEPPELRA